MKGVGHRLTMSLLLLLLSTFCGVFVAAQPLTSDQVKALLGVQSLLEFPSAISSWSTTTDFCNLESTEGVTLGCSGGSLTQLHIVGDKVQNAGPLQKSAQNLTGVEMLSSKFSLPELVDSLTVFEELRTLSLVSLGIWGAAEDLGRLDNLTSLEVINLSRNVILGTLPSRWGHIPSLQVIDLSDNALSGTVPDFSGSFLNVSLVTYSLANNLLSGPFPVSLSRLTSLRNLYLDGNEVSGRFPEGLSNLSNLEVLTLGLNRMSGPIPSFKSLVNLKVLDLRGNDFGPNFPELGGKGLTVLELSGNKLAGSLPSFLASYPGLLTLNLAFNDFTGSIPPYLFSLPSLSTLLLQNNHLSGSLPENLAVSDSLQAIDISNNFLTGPLPVSLGSSLDAPTTNRTLPKSKPTVNFVNNCFNSTPQALAQQQQPQAYCEREVQTSFANESSSRGKKDNIAIIAGIAGGGAGLLGALLILVVVCTRRLMNKDGKAADSTSVDQSSVNSSIPPTTRNGVPSDLLSKARFITLSTKLGVLSFSHNKAYSLEQLASATNGFNRSHLLGLGKKGKVFKGKLEDGTLVAIKCVAIEPTLDVADLKVHLATLVKLRHQNLVSLLGYCVESEPDNSQGRRRLFLVSEFIPNGTLRSHLTRGKNGEEPLSWAERLYAVVGAGRGLQYLHSGVLSGNIKHQIQIHNILLDQQLVAKLSDFGLPRPGLEASEMDAIALVRRTAGLDHHRSKLCADKADVYNFGLILLEIVMGRPPLVENPTSGTPNVPELAMLLKDENGPTVDMIDPSIIGSYVPESLATVLEIASKCLSEDVVARPSMEDALWNLQYAAQVQDTSATGDTESADLIELQNIHGFGVHNSRSRGYRLAITSSELQRG